MVVEVPSSSVVLSESFGGTYAVVLAAKGESFSSLPNKVIPSLSIPQIKELRTITPATIAKNSTIQTPNRSCGLKPTDAASDAIPAVVPSGNIRSSLGADESIKIAEFWSFSWSEKSEDGL